jgi:hypothetical protein
VLHTHKVLGSNPKSSIFFCLACFSRIPFLHFYCGPVQRTVKTQRNSERSEEVRWILAVRWTRSNLYQRTSRGSWSGNGDVPAGPPECANAPFALGPRAFSQVDPLYHPLPMCPSRFNNRGPRTAHRALIFAQFWWTPFSIHVFPIHPMLPSEMLRICIPHAGRLCSLRCSS